MLPILVPSITDDFASLTSFASYGIWYLNVMGASYFVWHTLYLHSGLKLKKAFFCAVAIFNLGSLSCAIAESSTEFTLSRAIVAFGASGIYYGYLVVMILQPKRPYDHGAWVAVPAMIYAVASNLGTFLGGLVAYVCYLFERAFLYANLKREPEFWRWAFYFNFGLGIFVAANVTILVDVPIRSKIQFGDYYRNMSRQLSTGPATSFGGCVYAIFVMIVYNLQVWFQGVLGFNALFSMAATHALDLPCALPLAVALFLGKKGIHRRFFTLLLPVVPFLLVSLPILVDSGFSLMWALCYGIALVLLGLGLDIGMMTSLFVALKDQRPVDMLIHLTEIMVIQSYFGATSLWTANIVVETGLKVNLAAFLPKSLISNGTGATTIYSSVDPDSQEDFKNAYSNVVAGVAFPALAIAILGFAELFITWWTYKTEKDAKKDPEEKAEEKGDSEAKKE